MNEVSEGSYIKYFTDDHSVVSKYCVVIKPAIKEYLLNNPRSLFIDGTFSKDSGQLFCFSFMDCNHHIQPMGCLYSKSENTNDITILFNELWNSGLSEAKHIIFVSDDGTAINAFVQGVMKDHGDIRIEHVKCVSHLLRHMKTILADNDLESKYDLVRMLFYYARRSPTEQLANYFLSIIKDVCEDVYKYIVDKCMSCFIYKYDTPHYSIDTNNVSESVMNMLKSITFDFKTARKAGIFGCLYRFVYVSLEAMYKRREYVPCVSDENLKSFGNYDYFCEYIVSEMARIGYSYEVVKNRYSIKRHDEGTKKYVIYDDEWKCNFEVDFDTRKCSCLAFQQNQYPCIHGVAALHMTNQYHMVMSYVNRQYSAFEIRKKITKVDMEKVMHMADNISCDSELNKELEKVIEDLKVLKFEKKRLRKRRASHGEVLAKRICRKSVKASIKEKNVGLRGNNQDGDGLMNIPLKD